MPILNSINNLNVLLNGLCTQWFFTVAYFIYLITRKDFFHSMFKNCIYKDYFKTNEQRNYVKYISLGQKVLFELTRLSEQKYMGHPNHSPKALLCSKKASKSSSCLINVWHM